MKLLNSSKPLVACARDLDTEANYRRISLDSEAMREPLRQLKLEEDNRRFARSAAMAAWVCVFVALVAVIMQMR